MNPPAERPAGGGADAGARADAVAADTPVRVLGMALSAGIRAEGRYQVPAEVAVSLPSLARWHRCTGQLLANVDAGLVGGVAGEVLDALRRFHHHALKQTLMAEAALVEAVELLEATGIHPIVIKGLAYAHLDADDPSHRTTADVDLLLPPDTIHAAIDALRTVSKGVPMVPGPTPEWQRRYSKAVTVVQADGVEMDLHQHIVQGYFGLSIDHAALTAGTQGFAVGDLELTALDQPRRLVHAAFHLASTEHLSLHAACDVAQMVFGRAADWRAAADLATAWDVDALFAAGVRRAWDSLALPVHPVGEWAETHRAARRQQLALRLAHHPMGHRLSAPLALPVRQWPSYLAPFLRPSPQYLEHHGRSPQGQVRRILTISVTGLRDVTTGRAARRNGT